jgi:hypothetical protein
MLDMIKSSKHVKMLPESILKHRYVFLKLLKRLPPYALAGFDLTPHNSAGGDLTTPPGHSRVFLQKNNLKNFSEY